MLILAAILGVLVYGMIAALLGSILPELSKRFKLTPAQMGQIALSQAVGLVLASIIYGPLEANTGKQATLAIGLAIAGVSLFLLPRSGGFGSVAGLLLGVGLGGGIIVAGANGLNGNISEANNMPIASVSNFLNLFFGLGGLITPLIAASLFRGDSRKLLMMITGFAALALVATMIAPIPGPTGAGGAAFAGAGDVLGNVSFWLVAALFFLYIASEVGVWNWLVQHLVAQGIAEKTALTVLSLGFALGLLLGRLVVAGALQNVPPVQVVLGASVLMAVTTFMMLQSRDPKIAGASVFVAGLAMAPVFPTTIAITQTLFPNNGTALGLALVFGWAGLAASSPLIGGIAGGDTKRLKIALLVLPAAAVLMIGINLALMSR